MVDTHLIEDSEIRTGVVGYLASNKPVPRLGSLEGQIQAESDRVNELQNKLFEVPEEFKNRYSQFLLGPDTGLVRLQPSGKYDRVLPLRGGGAYYYFTGLSHEYGYGSDIQYSLTGFSTGFAGLDFGFFLPLGDVAIQEVSGASPFPSWLSPSLQEAWTYCWTYQPRRNV